MHIKSDSPASERCFFCKGKEHTFMYQATDVYGNPWQYWECCQCKGVNLLPHPSAESMEQAYSEAYYGESDEKFRGGAGKLFQYFRKQRARRWARQFNENADILDFGCGDGSFLHHLSWQKPFSLYGFERPGKAAQRAAQHGEIYLSTDQIPKARYSKEGFNAITMFHVFEHLDNPSQTLSILGRNLAPNGLLILSFPNIHSVQARLFRSRWLHLDPPRHLFFPEIKSLKKHMEEMGFEMISQRYFCPEQNPFGGVQSFLNLFTKRRDILLEAMKGNKAITSEIPAVSILFQKIAAALLFPVFLVSEWMFSAFKNGATVELAFRKTAIRKPEA